MTDQPFKHCPACGQRWVLRDDLLVDPEVLVVGYQAFIGEDMAGFFLFNHARCGTTMAIPPEDFASLYNGPIFTERLDDHPECPDYCLKVDDLRACQLECECAYVREILQVVRSWPKAP